MQSNKAAKCSVTAECGIKNRTVKVRGTLSVYGKSNQVDYFLTIDRTNGLYYQIVEQKVSSRAQMASLKSDLDDYLLQNETRRGFNWKLPEGWRPRWATSTSGSASTPTSTSSSHSEEEDGWFAKMKKCDCLPALVGYPLYSLLHEVKMHNLTLLLLQYFRQEPKEWWDSRHV